MEASWVFGREGLCDYFKQQGIDEKKDHDRRINTIPKILQVCKEASFSRHASYVACMYYHRLLVCMPPPLNDSLLAILAIFIAGKAEEHYRRIDDTCKAWVLISPQSDTNTNDTIVTREKVLSLEYTAMARLGFHFSMDTPLKHFIRAMAGCDDMIEPGLKILDRVMATPCTLMYNQREIGAACAMLAFGPASVDDHFDQLVASAKINDKQSLLDCYEYLKRIIIL